MNGTWTSAPRDHRTLELLAALNGGCVKTTDAAINEAVAGYAEATIRSLADIALRAVEIAATQAQVRPDDILAVVVRDLEHEENDTSPRAEQTIRRCAPHSSARGQ
jgi:hypothetical protein